jgi:magnesium-protoporphyrin O-methyltransferase
VVVKAFFTPRQAKRAAKRYRGRGVEKTAERMLAFLEDRGLEGASVLEIGGGIGDLQLEALKLSGARKSEVGRSTAARS